VCNELIRAHKLTSLLAKPIRNKLLTVDSLIWEARDPPSSVNFNCSLLTIGLCDICVQCPGSEPGLQQ
jgi:hypothetical protein